MSKFKEHATAQLPVEVTKWFNFFTFDVIGDLTFGESFGCLQTGKLHPWVSMTLDFIKAGAVFKFIYQYPALRFLVNLVLGNEMHKRHMNHRQASVEMADKRMALGTQIESRKDFMYHILRHNNDKGMSTAEIHANAPVLVAGGSETTATGLSGILFYLCFNPRSKDRLVQELRTAFSSSKEINMKSTARLKYLNVVVEEGFRIFPPTPEYPTRVSPGATIDNQFVPEGVSISSPTLYENQLTCYRL